MSTPKPPRGGAPVGFLTELPNLEAAAVCFLRLWCEGMERQQQAKRDLTDLLGQQRGRLAADSLRQICDLFTRFGRRPVMRHQSGCSCLGADEACFANLVSAAAIGEREDALLFAMLMLRVDFAPAVVGLAEQFGLALKSLERTKPDVALDGLPECATMH